MILTKDLFKTQNNHNVYNLQMGLSKGFEESGIAIIRCHNENRFYNTDYSINYEKELYNLDYIYCPYCSKKILKENEEE